ncbi:SGNH hydrolase [Mytilinidion resinicola]|uniref:SGNH hydrolase n=1 Tax=Mytilinidion resinicola TaxID=574789 RepID=A0A6A6Y8S4_9PEZI|nr:SGNH hydrolase [Mytilinidion resinicola]KAF2804963.1 SGNH hydrolase [Mytilinidion resinicola]
MPGIPLAILSITLLATTALSFAVPHLSLAPNIPSIPSLPSIPNIAELLPDQPLYTRPTHPITTILAIGDSYTAGEGANGFPDYIASSANCDRYKQSWPLQLIADPAWDSFNGKKPALVFGACSGATMNDLIANQLQLGVPNASEAYTKIGKPQIAVMTIGGNDADFFGAINACILHLSPSLPCSQKLTSISAHLASPAFATALATTLATILTTARAAGGAVPPESFELYVAGYVPFFNTHNPVCDNVSFSIHGDGVPKLTTELRKSLNAVVEEFNGVLEGVARAMRPWGVFWVDVDGWSKGWGGHRFCEHTAAEGEVWFWGGEGDGGGDVRRVFHPKGVGYKVFAEAFLEAVRGNR